MLSKNIPSTATRRLDIKEPSNGDFTRSHPDRSGSQRAKDRPHRPTLAHFLRDPGPGRLRELHYLVLTGPAGPPLWHTIGQSHDLNHTISFIRDHLDQPLAIDDLAQHAGMSRPVFDRRFRRATSYAPLQFIRALRLNAAATLITQGSDITTASFKVGYASPAQFSRDFKRHYGQPPKQWSRTANALEPTP